jgi:hypothetical protein
VFRLGGVADLGFTGSASPSLVSDEEHGVVQVFLPWAGGRLATEMGTDLSAAGSFTDGVARVVPGWDLSWENSDAPVQPFGRLSGSYRWEPRSSGSQVRHEAEVGMKWSPDLEWDLSLSAFAGTTTYAASPERVDADTGGGLAASVLWGYLTRIEVKLLPDWWFSTVPGNEALRLNFSASAKTSPQRQWGLETTVAAQSVVGNATVESRTLGSTVHLDWSPDGSTFVFGEVNGSATWGGTSPGWTAGVSAGVEWTF